MPAQPEYLGRGSNCFDKRQIARCLRSMNLRLQLLGLDASATVIPQDGRMQRAIITVEDDKGLSLRCDRQGRDVRVAGSCRLVRGLTRRDIDQVNGDLGMASRG